MPDTMVIPEVLADEAELRATHVWRAYHIFYGGNPLIVLRECILPLAEDLQREEASSRTTSSSTTGSKAPTSA